MKTIETEAEHLARQPHHELRNATTVAGVIVAAAAGAIAGPVGILVGGLFGVAAGFAGGVVLEREDRRAAVHDRELDDAIGVTTPDLGAANIASSALTKIEEEAQ